MREALNGRDVVRLKGGDPLIFGRGGEEAELARAHGVPVVLVSNVPRPSTTMPQALARLDFPADAWDVVATSGDSARAAMFRGAVGQKVYFIGEDHDKSFFEPLKLIEDPVSIEQVPLRDADGIVCCGPFDPHADPSVYRGDFLFAKTKGLKLLCANPDIVVDRGESREWCAGALAALYTDMGGESLYFGKPYPPIYDLARRRLAALGTVPSDPRIIAIGDGIRTDMAGAADFGLDAVFVASGLHVGPGGEGLDDLRLAELFEGRKAPRAAMPALAW